MDTEQDPEWDALLALVRARPDLLRASRALADESGLDEEGGVRRLVWAALQNGRGLPEAAWQVLSPERDDDDPGDDPDDGSTGRGTGAGPGSGPSGGAGAGPSGGHGPLGRSGLPGVPWSDGGRQPRLDGGTGLS